MQSLRGYGSENSGEFLPEMPPARPHLGVEAPHGSGSHHAPPPRSSRRPSGHPRRRPHLDHGAARGGGFRRQSR